RFLRHDIVIISHCRTLGDAPSSATMCPAFRRAEQPGRLEEMTTIRESQTIQGVYIAELAAYGDERGRFSEAFRKSWFPHRHWERIQFNRSESHAGVVRGLHYHFHQV